MEGTGLPPDLAKLDDQTTKSTIPQEPVSKTPHHLNPKLSIAISVSLAVVCLVCAFGVAYYLYTDYRRKEQLRLQSEQNQQAQENQKRREEERRGVPVL